MPTFRSSKPSYDLPPEGVYMMQALDASEQNSSNGSEMLKLKFTIIPNNKWVWDYLVFTEKAFWVVSDFCRSAGLELPGDNIDVVIVPADVMFRICYGELVHERGKDGKTRLSVERYITREEALKLSPSLARVAMPRHVPEPKKLPRASKGQNAVADASPATTKDPDLEVESDDIPF